MKTLSQLVAPTDILSSKVTTSLSISTISQSTATLSPNTLFFAIKGTSQDGHAFAKTALEKGATAIVVESEDVYRETPKTILVHSTRETFAKAAAKLYDEPTKHLDVVGITGTNGKTTTTFLLRSLWQSLNLKSGVIGTVENYIDDKAIPSELTTPDPLTLQKLFHEMKEAKCTHAAVEVSSIALDQFRVSGTQFAVALFTNFTQDHLDYHGSFENYYEAKRRLFTELKPRHAIFNTDDAAGEKLHREFAGKKSSFALDKNADFTAESATYDKSGTRARLKTPAGTFDFSSPLIGKHNLYNCLGVIASAHALGHDLSSAIKALSDADGAPGRLERAIREKGKPHVFVDYAHTPDALENVLNALRELRGNGPGKIITVFGCGGDRDKTKRPKMATIASTLSDVTVATSDNPRTENPDAILDDVEGGIEKSKTVYRRVVNRRSAIHEALSLASSEDIVLIAGKGHETYQILGKEKFPFDDREVVREYYASCTHG